MKKTIRKLTLNKETLRHLEGRALHGAAGAARTDRCDTSPLQCPVGSDTPSGCAPTFCEVCTITCGDSCTC